LIELLVSMIISPKNLLDIKCNLIFFIITNVLQLYLVAELVAQNLNY
jgi:hypothetical protein